MQLGRRVYPVKEGTVVDATPIAAPGSTKNEGASGYLRCIRRRRATLCTLV